MGVSDREEGAVLAIRATAEEKTAGPAAGYGYSFYQESINTMKADILELLLRSRAEGDESPFSKAARRLAAAEGTTGQAFVGTCSNSFDVGGSLQSRQGGQR